MFFTVRHLWHVLSRESALFPIRQVVENQVCGSRLQQKRHEEGRTSPDMQRQKQNQNNTQTFLVFLKSPDSWGSEDSPMPNMLHVDIRRESSFYFKPIIFCVLYHWLILCRLCVPTNWLTELGPVECQDMPVDCVNAKVQDFPPRLLCWNWCFVVLRCCRSQNDSYQSIPWHEMHPHFQGLHT